MSGKILIKRIFQSTQMENTVQNLQRRVNGVDYHAGKVCMSP